MLCLHAYRTLLLATCQISHACCDKQYLKLNLLLHCLQLCYQLQCHQVLCHPLLQEVSLQSSRVTKMSLATCAVLRQLSFPELDHAVAQRLAGPAAKSSSSAGSKVSIAFDIGALWCLVFQ